MRTIGLRASPSEVVFAVYGSKAKKLVNVESIIVPLAFTTPQALKYIRYSLIDILREYQIEKAGIRVTEGIAQNQNKDRIQIEGVLQETFASSSLTSYYIGYASSISSYCGIQYRDFKDVIGGDNKLNLDGWGGFSKAQREAVLSAIGAVNA